MPPTYDRIRPIDRVTQVADLVHIINERLEEINRVLAEIALSESRTRGDDGLTPTFNANIDLSRKRVTNVAKSEHPNDVVTRQELIELGLYSSDGRINFTRPVLFSSEARFGDNPGGGNSLITEETVIEIVTALLEEALAVAVDGKFLDKRFLGYNGTDKGNPLMGRDEQGRAVFIKSDNEQISVHDAGVRGLLEMILRELQRINGDGD